MRACPPFSPFSDSKSVILSGQHSCLGAKEIGDQIEKEEDNPRPRWTEYVVATILKHDTPIDIRRMAAGRGQAAQENIGKLRLARTAYFLHDLLCKTAGEKTLAECMWQATMMGAEKNPESKV